MSTKTLALLEQFRALPPDERKEFVSAISQEREARGKPRRSLADVAGKYPPLPDDGVRDNDWWFTQAILDSKNPPSEP